MGTPPWDGLLKVNQHLYPAAVWLQEDLNEAVATMTGVFILDGCQAGHLGAGNVPGGRNRGNIQKDLTLIISRVQKYFAVPHSLKHSTSRVDDSG